MITDYFHKKYYPDLTREQVDAAINKDENTYNKAVDFLHKNYYNDIDRSNFSKILGEKDPIKKVESNDIRTKFKIKDYDKYQSAYGEDKIFPKNKKEFKLEYGLGKGEDPLISYKPADFSKYEEAKNFDFNSKYDNDLINKQIDYSSNGIYKQQTNPNWNEQFDKIGTDPSALNDETLSMDGYKIDNSFPNRKYFEISPNESKVRNAYIAREQNYKNSDLFIERNAASYFHNTLDLDKWLNDTSYREELTKKYLNENPSAKDVIKTVRNNSPIVNVAQEDTGYSSKNGINIINVNPAFSKNNLTENQRYELFKKQRDPEGRRADYVLREAFNMMNVNENTNSVVSHEYYHNTYDKSDLLKNNKNSIKNVYPENEMLWKLNTSTKDKPYVESSGFADYSKDEANQLDHLSSPEETKADIHATRDYLKRKYGYDHITNDFTDKEYNDLIKDKEFTDNLIGGRMIKRFTNKNDFKKVMNIIASNASPSNEGTA